MKNIFAFAALVFAFQTSHATSIRTCRPIVKAKPSQIYCKEGSTSVAIEIQTYMSDVRICPGKLYQQTSTANVQISVDGILTQELNYQDGEFAYKLGISDATFATADGALNLKGCSSPLNGAGMSVGN